MSSETRSVSEMRTGSVTTREHAERVLPSKREALEVEA
jgi:hypothetical protein